MTWDEIAERAEKATGVDTDLEGAVWLLAGQPFRSNMRYTTSVDAMLALIAEKLPNAGVDLNRFCPEIMIGEGPEWMAEVQPAGGIAASEDLLVDGYTPALALLAAFARAMAAQETRQEIAA